MVGRGSKVVGDLLEVTILNLITPRTTLSSGSFKVYTKDSAGDVINFIETELFVTMRYGKTIEGARIKSSEGIVGVIADHTFTFNTPIPLVETDFFMIIYPNQTQPPLNPNNCVGEKALDDKQDCYVIEKILQTESL